MELPNSWSVIGLSDICKIETGKWDANHSTDNGKYRFYTCAYDFFFCDTKRFSGECLILAGNGANVGEVFFYNGEFDAYQRTYVINEISILPKYLYYHFLWNWKRLNSDKQYGSATNYIRIGNFTDYNVFVSPLPEQHRIVTKIEELFSELDKGIESLKTAQQQLKIYRQSLLKHAFSGKLTEQWRADNQDKLETADALLARIQSEREERYQAQLKDWEDNGRQGTKPKAPKVMPPLTDEELAELPELPEGWGWVKFGRLIESSQNGLSKRGSETGKNYVVLRLADITNQKIDSNEFREIRLSPKEISQYKLLKNDLLCIRVNGSLDLVGRIIVVNSHEELAYCDHFIRYRILNKICDSVFISSFFNLANVRKYIELNCVSSAGQNTVNQEMLSSITLSICSIEEQKEIKNQLESRLSRVDQLEQTIITALQQSELLRQSILKKAFSGLLVPQDPNDEPASVLLERIKAEKAALINPTIKKTKSGKKTST
jgi:type I restriction enzyme S subunit